MAKRRGGSASYRVAPFVFGVNMNQAERGKISGSGVVIPAKPKEQEKPK